MNQPLPDEELDKILEEFGYAIVNHPEASQIRHIRTYKPAFQAYTNKAVAEALERVEREAPGDQKTGGTSQDGAYVSGLNSANALWRTALSKIKGEALRDVSE